MKAELYNSYTKRGDAMREMWRRYKARPELGIPRLRKRWTYSQDLWRVYDKIGDLPGRNDNLASWRISGRNHSSQ